MSPYKIKRCLFLVLKALYYASTPLCINDIFLFHPSVMECFHCNLYGLLIHMIMIKHFYTEREGLGELITWMMSMSGCPWLKINNISFHACALSSIWTSGGLFSASHALMSPDKPHQDCLNPSPSVYLTPFPYFAFMHTVSYQKLDGCEGPDIRLPHYVIIVFPDLIMSL